MLVLSRKIGDKIGFRLTDGRMIWLEPLEIRDDGNRVAIGIDAPIDIKIHRGEVWEKIHKETDKQIDNRASESLV